MSELTDLQEDIVSQMACGAFLSSDHGSDVMLNTPPKISANEFPKPISTNTFKSLRGKGIIFKDGRSPYDNLRDKWILTEKGRELVPDESTV